MASSNSLRGGGFSKIEVVPHAADSEFAGLSKSELDRGRLVFEDFPEFIEVDFFRFRGVVLLDVSGAFSTFCVVATGVDNSFAVSLMTQLVDGQFEVRSAKLSDISSAIERNHSEDLRVSRSKGEGEVDRLRVQAQQSPVVRYISSLLSGAVAQNVSDIHFEPMLDGLSVRYRINGELRSAEPPPTGYEAAAISRVKVLSSLDIAERRRPQDGRARIELPTSASSDGPTIVDVRVATSPSLHGESIVMRILRRETEAPTLAGLGAATELVSDLELLLARTTGLVFVTGPTGSGKTTTLYAMLGRLKDPRRKIITIEDPVEYEIDGLTQIQVHSDIGLDFASVLRSVVRQNPDILMVGETRDAETAKASMQAALSGHLVLSSLHTSDAASAVARLSEMGAEPYAIASTLNAVVAQRLLRRLCPQCRQPCEVTPRVRAVLEAAGAEVEGDWTAPGCDECRDGFVGRVAVFELLHIDELIREMIMRRAPAAEIRSAARAKGVPSLLDEALRLAKDGETSLTEVIEKVGAI